MFDALKKFFKPEISGVNRSRDFNRLYGDYIVLYSDGTRSEPMCHDVANNYANIFGGIVVKKEHQLEEGEVEHV